MKEVISANLGFKRWFFFIAGIIATLAYRIIIVLNADWIRIAWYVGTVGFILYFWHILINCFTVKSFIICLYEI